ncbi:hypothetical protein GF319_05830, partial [Candidatus Bathyarchaeota archaeon]|nr:hypothetical protein [Candidatus Bathyarchaeota archaeon]
MIKGGTAKVNVTASTSGYLNAWVDFNGDWGWENNEKVFNDEPLSPGINSLEVQVPEEDNETTFARFRFSTVQGLDPCEYAPDGEVEDYKLLIFDPPMLTAENREIIDEALNITVCNNFNLELWVRNITGGLSVVGLDFIVEWDPALMEYVTHQTFNHGLQYTEKLNESEGTLLINIPPDTVNPVTDDDIWANITLHCLGEGVSDVNVSSIETIWLWDGVGEPFG